MNKKHDDRRPVARICLFCGFIALAGMLMSGCMVSKKEYEAAVADMESAKTELEKSRMMREALEQENNKLRNENEKVALDLEMMASEIQRIKEGRESERELLAAREAEVAQKSQMLTTQFEKLKQGYQKLKSQNRALKDTVQRYQKELKEARQAKAELAAKASEPSSSTRRSSQAKPLVASKPKPSPEAAPVVSPGKNALGPVNINTASANDLVLFLGLTKNMAEKVIANRPYRLRGELVAKQVVPKATFDVIKDRITAAPK